MRHVQFSKSKTYKMCDVFIPIKITSEAITSLRLYHIWHYTNPYVFGWYELPQPINEVSVQSPACWFMVNVSDIGPGIVWHIHHNAQKHVLFEKSTSFHWPAKLQLFLQARYAEWICFIPVAKYYLKCKKKCTNLSIHSRHIVRMS